MGFRAEVKAIRYSMNTALNYLVITNDFALRMFMRRKEGGRGHRDACVGTWDLGTRDEGLEDIKYGTRRRQTQGRGM